ncbi:MAG: polysaccharide deacetylase family protein [Deltaproteobacteria bacterium]|nr:polysaccharide deacetylase family protein [Deltaproteobacteria bacterium]
MPPKKYIPFLMLAMLLLAAWPEPAAGADPVVIWGGPANVRQVAITFDDGPSPRYTPQILALLQQYQAHATFFVLGRKVEQYPHLVQALLQAGNEVGNHTFDHPRLTTTAEAVRESQVERTALDLELLGDRTSRWIRPPFSAYDARFKDYVAHTQGRLVLWSIDSGDWKGLDRDTIVNNVVSRVKPGAIIIFHDSDEKDKADRSPTVEALKLILPALQELGYRLVTISQLVAGDSAPNPAAVQAGPDQPVKPHLDFRAKVSKSGAL